MTAMTEVQERPEVETEESTSSGMDATYSLQGCLGASFVYPNGAVETLDWIERMLKKGKKRPKKITLGTDEIIPVNAKTLREVRLRNQVKSSEIK